MQTQDLFLAREVLLSLSEVSRAEKNAAREQVYWQVIWAVWKQYLSFDDETRRSEIEQSGSGTDMGENEKR